MKGTGCMAEMRVMDPGFGCFSPHTTAPVCHLFARSGSVPRIVTLPTYSGLQLETVSDILPETKSQHLYVGRNIFDRNSHKVVRNDVCFSNIQPVSQ